MQRPAASERSRPDLDRPQSQSYRPRDDDDEINGEGDDHGDCGGVASATTTSSTAVQPALTAVQQALFAPRGLLVDIKGIWHETMISGDIRRWRL